MRRSLIKRPLMNGRRRSKKFQLLKVGRKTKSLKELVKDVATKVLMQLKKKHVDVTENLVGMDHHERILTELLAVDRDDVRIVGIVGMGGIGKTTIAKAVYNKLCDTFNQCCSFLENVRENERQGGFNTLQNQLVSDILKRPSDGMQLNGSTFRNKKALIVLDDVDKKSQMVEIIRTSN